MPETTSRPPGSGQRQRSRWWALAALSLSLLVVGLDTYVLNTALPTLSAKLGASTQPAAVDHRRLHPGHGGGPAARGPAG